MEISVTGTRREVLLSVFHLLGPRKVGELAGKTPQTVRKWISGQTSPTLNVFNKLVSSAGLYVRYRTTAEGEEEFELFGRIAASELEHGRRSPVSVS